MAPHLAHLLLVREAAPDYGDVLSSDSFDRPDELNSDPSHEAGTPTASPPDVFDAPIPDPSDDAGASVLDPFDDAGASVLDPFDDADALEELEEEVVTLAAQIHAATHRLLTLIAEFDRRRGWELGGHRTAAHWLSFPTGIDLGAAREKVRAARVLEDLPLTSASMARGELSFSKVRALTVVGSQTREFG